MDELSIGALSLVLLIFIWSGFVRSALGFGGAALSLPLFLFIIKDPVDIIPIIGVHMLIAAVADFRKNHRKIDWSFLQKSLPVLFIFEVLGVIGLLNLSPNVINIGVYLIVSAYALSYLMQKKLISKSKLLDWLLLSAGGYICGTSLIGAPLIIAVYGKYVSVDKLRSTLFMLWLILVLVKLSAFIASGTDLQLRWALITLPFAFVGHMLGEVVHQKILAVDKTFLLRWIGCGLLLICLSGIARIVLS